MTLSPRIDRTERDAFDADARDPSAQSKRLLLTLLSEDSDPLADELVKRIVDAGGVPFVLGGNPWLQRTLLTHARWPDQVAFEGPDFFAFRRMDKAFQSDRDPPLERLPGGSPQIDSTLRQAATERSRALSAIDYRAAEGQGRAEHAPRGKTGCASGSG
ncbi:MAG: hypothetical protein ACKVPX_09365 [Myxococcaceae bacterium]